jgi:hypothetical protein
VRDNDSAEYLIFTKSIRVFQSGYGPSNSFASIGIKVDLKNSSMQAITFGSAEIGLDKVMFVILCCKFKANESFCWNYLIFYCFCYGLLSRVQLVFFKLR